MADVPQHAAQHRAHHQRLPLRAALAEYTAKPHADERHDVIQQDDHHHGYGGGEVGKVVHPQQKLQQRIRRS